MHVDPRTEYSTRLERRRAALNLEQQAHRRHGNARVAVFFVSLAMAYAAFGLSVFSAWWLVVPVSLLVALGLRMERLEARISKCVRAVTFYELALARLDDRWRGQGETGTRFSNDQHLYATDLDILGDASLFELLCLARTERGEATLAAWLLTAAPPEAIAARQQAVKELAPLLDLREDLALAGDTARARVHADRLVAWGEESVWLLHPAFRLAAWLLSAFGALAAATGVTWIVNSLGLIELDVETLATIRVFTLSTWAVCLAVHWGLKRRTDHTIDDVFSAGHDLGLLSGLLERLEHESFASSYPAALRDALVIKGRPASARIATLETYVGLLNLRRNELMRLLGPFLLWDLHVSQAIERWRLASGREIGRWLDTVGAFEALASFACFRYERPTTTFPEVPEVPAVAEVAEVVEMRPELEAENLRHPLLPEHRAVPNSVHLGDEPRVLVVSGSNMSGKSTLLRTIGINVALAQAGAPVCASRMRLTPLAIGASIRIQDSLQEGTSRFYAEVTRLSRVMERAGSKPPVLFLIDEMLHGTNSHDRLIGAEAIVRGLVERDAIGLITTHDLALTRIVDALGPRAANIHFQDYLEGGTMRFDYRVRPGVVQHSNALELMRSVGLKV